MEENFGVPEKESSLFTSPPDGFESENDFLNCCSLYKTMHPPEECLKITQDIERKIGRKEKSINGKFSSRKIDIDILYYDNLTLKSEELTIPHYAIKERIFVLKPLKEIIPTFLDPFLKKTIDNLYENCPKSTCIKKNSP